MKAVIVDASRTLPGEWQRHGLDLVNGTAVDVPQSLIDERRLKGIDVFDEVWEGVLHMVPPPSGDHQHIGGRLFVALDRAARGRELEVRYESGFYRAPKDYRTPDLVVFRPEHRIPAGVCGAELVVEIRSPRDETDKKLDWYAARGVAEIVAIDQRTRDVELYVPRDGTARRVPAGPDGGVDLATVGLRLAPVDARDGRRLHITGRLGEAGAEGDIDELA